MKHQSALKETEIGMIPNDWKVASLKDTCTDISYGYTASACQENTGPKFLRITDIVGKVIDWQSVPYCEIEPSQKKKYELQNGDIVIARTGANTGATAIIKRPPDAIFASYLIRFRIDPQKTAPFFVGHTLKSTRWNSFVQEIIGGSAQPGANAQQFGRFQLSLPPLPEQFAVAKILSDLDTQIELNQQMNTTLENIGQTLFKHWFIDFEFPNENGKPYKSSGGEMFYIEAVGQELPKGWEKGSVSDLVNHSKDTISPYDSPEKIFFHYSIPSYDEGKWPSMEKGNFIKSNKFLVKSNSILVSKLNPRMPRIWAVGEVDESCSVCSTEFQVLAPKKKWNYNYVYFSFKSVEITDEMKSLVTGTSGSHQRVRPEDMLNLKIVIPDEGVLQKFEDITYCLQQKRWQLGIENKHLCSIRDVLLPKLMSGQIRVEGSRE